MPIASTARREPYSGCTIRISRFAIASHSRSPGLKLKDFCLLSLLTLGALLVHGYHPWVEDAEIYLPGVEKILHPELFPFNAQFFESHAHLTFFPNFVATSVRLSHLPLIFVLLFWHTGFHLSASAGLLAAKRQLLHRSQGSLGRRGSGRCASDLAGGGNRSLHHG